jgi:alkylhydroperoxidase family enzyme
VKKHFTEAQIVELTAAIALENFRSKFNPALGSAEGTTAEAVTPSRC